MQFKSRTIAAGLMAIGVILFVIRDGARATVFDEETAWLPEVEELLVADTYSTPASAARALGHRLTQELRNHAGHDGLRTIRVRVTGQTAESEAVRQAFCQALPSDTSVQVRHSDSDDEPGSNGRRDRDDRTVDADLDLHLDASSDGEPTGGRLELICALPGKHFSASAQFVDKPWVESISRAKPRKSAQDLVCVRGLAEQPGVDFTQSVIFKAVEEEVLPRVLARVESRFPSQGEWAKRFVKERLVRDIVDHPVLVDRFPQSFHKPLDGEDHVVLVREAVLLDVSDDTIGQLAGPLVRQVRRFQERRWGALALGGGGMFVSLAIGLLGYNLLNSFTRGYYVWKLRLATAAFWLISMTLAARMASAMLSAG